MQDLSRLYRVIAVYGGPRDGPKSVSEKDGAPGYLHMHILDNHFLQGASLTQQGEPNVLYQWGRPEDHRQNKRSVTVTEEQRAIYGSLGIGSAAIGSERTGDFCGGGEGFIYGDKSYRIIKGNQVIEMEKDLGYWTLQLTAFQGRQIIDQVSKATSREGLVNQLIQATGHDQMFITTFLARFPVQSLYARSNGIFPHDPVDYPLLNSFSGEVAVGGHVIGDSDKSGDIATPNHKLASVELYIEGSIELELINEVKIALPGRWDEFQSICTF
jgi:hypothetical protein